MTAAVRRPRRVVGFTVLEVLLALVLTAVAVTLAASALRASTRVRDGVQRAHGRVDQALRWRGLLTDMLRHAPPADMVDEPLLRITPDGTGSPVLTFLSRGVRMPYGTGPAWRVTVHLGADGLVMDALPLGRSPDGTQLHTVLPGVTALRVRVRDAAGPLDAARWRDDWPVAASRPAALLLELDGDGAPAPLVVPLDPLQDAVRPRG